MVSNTVLAHAQPHESFPGYQLQHDKRTVFSDSRRTFFLSEDLPPDWARLWYLPVENFPFYLLLIGCFPWNRSSRELPQGAEVGSAGWLAADGSNREPTPPFLGILMLRGDGSICRKRILEREKRSLSILLSVNLVIVYSNFSSVRDKPLEFGTVT